MSLEDFKRSFPDYKAEEKPSEKIVEVETAKDVKRQQKTKRPTLTEEERQALKKKRDQLRKFRERQRAEREKEGCRIARLREGYRIPEDRRKCFNGHISDTKDE
jgi:hypothetical protein